MLTRRAAGGPLNVDKTCDRQVAVTRHSAKWFNNSVGDCNPTSAPWATAMNLVTQRHNTVPMTECRVAGDKTRRAHAVEDIIGYS
jgi:hypothetical protein